MPLKNLLKERFRSAIQSIPQGQWKALVTDAHSQALLDSVYTKYDILQQNVTSIEPLHSARGPMQVEGLYILTPTAQNVQRVIADFANGRRTYTSVHLYFIDGIDDRLATRLTDALQPMGVLRAFVELYCNVEPTEDRVFSMKTPSAFFSFYGQLGGQISADFAMEAFQDDLAVTSRTILNVLATLNENPYIRYYQPHHHAPLGPLSERGVQSSRVAPIEPEQNQSLRWRSALGSRSSQKAPVGDYLSKKIAEQVQSDLDEYMTNNPEFPEASERQRGVLFVVDRTMDPAAPLLHEFWYQAMVNDLLKIEDGTRYKYKYENTVGDKETRTAVLDDNDEVWVSIRHLHMKDAIDRLMADFGRFVQEHAGFRGNTNNVQINDLKDMLASLPQFQEQRDQYSLHLDMAQECMNMFEHRKLNLSANVEQCCATGFTADGKTPKTIVEEMVPLLDDRDISQLDKVRIIALYLIFREGVADEDRRRLYQHARLSITEQDMINNLVHMGIKVIKDKENRFRGSRVRNKYSSKDDQYDLSRYKPVVQIMAEDQASNKLDQSSFPYLRDAPQELASSSSMRSRQPTHPAAAGNSLRSARPMWHKATSARQTTDHQQRYIIFVAGGMTYSEIRQAYTLSAALGKDIVIGSTHIVTPESYLKDVKSLGRGGIGGNPPGGLPQHANAPGRPDWRNPAEPMPYQAILDQRYWEPEVGPPPMPPPPQQQAPQKRGALNETTRAFSEMSVSSTASKNSKHGGEKEKKKRNLFKMKWDK
ncbi:hypothetical protein CcaverHIS002_0305730 [Cutaneotrichosporon cavernicola]|uniref:Sec1-like protein n=1 Tax=Cutaneotrichosporon cavernicola TaxID=279322 RepID=A0AA48KZH0_9TREE|nr:uncharacterized protein CcaverHIS019_0305690 [Cutaneotrichosporon cavernicola]BEI82705.1 hypothetical protein CcaverHIS002_0305730 [Cutaneotrichosporon cavernicola]BEI90499.1 hypothetical protein CcaverHIS019_0305690 [Cutaneotrichosporon cavernicola]